MPKNPNTLKLMNPEKFNESGKISSSVNLVWRLTNFCMPFYFSTKQNRTNQVDWVRFGLVIKLNWTHRKVPAYHRTPNERLSSTDFWFGFVWLTTLGDRRSILKMVGDNWHSHVVIAELRRPKAAKQSPIPILGNWREPMNWFSHVYHG